jgi:hypothetical protein
MGSDTIIRKAMTHYSCVLPAAFISKPAVTRVTASRVTGSGLAAHDQSSPHATLGLGNLRFPVLDTKRRFARSWWNDCQRCSRSSSSNTATTPPLEPTRTSSGLIPCSLQNVKSRESKVFGASWSTVVLLRLSCSPVTGQR